ncbi:hypothetical protein [Faecalibacillus intestinalis]|uniref:hypothetical protein n=2 Tax=Bacteria TaxID=2 RepID=UPI0035200C32
MIKGELYKLLRSKSVKVLFILLLILNSFQIIYVNYQNIYGDISTGKRKILKIIEGPISQQKYDWLVNYHNTMLEQVNNGNYNTKNKSKNTFSGYVFGDEQISNNLLEDYEYTINYHSSIKNKITILDENIKKTQNSKWKKENIMLKKRLKNRNLSYYYDYTLINNFMNQDFQYLLSLIFCIILVIKLFIYEKQKQTDLYFYISRKQIKKIFISKILMILLFTFISSLLLLIESYLIYYFLGLITGCSSNQNNSSSFQYNSYHELNFAENKEYYYFSNKIIDKNDWKEYSLIRNLYESSNNLINVFPQKDGFFYTIDDDESEYLYLFNNDFQDVKLKKLSSLQKNFMNIEQQHIPISDKNILGIIGNKNRYYIIYSDKITNQNNKVVYKGKLTNHYSIYHQYLYFLQDDYTIIKISLDTFKKEKIDTPLCDYFYIKNNHLYLHNIQDDKLYCDNQILFNEQIENSDIYKDKLYYTQNDGLFMYDFTYKESTLLTKEKVYSLKISIDGKYLSYITDSTKKNKEIKIIIKDLKKNKIVYVRDA